MDPLSAASLLILTASTTATVGAVNTHASYPADPFADSYVLPQAVEVGTTVGQLRLFGLLGGAYHKDPELFFDGIAEIMASEFIGIRLGNVITLFKPAGVERISTVRIGPALHFLPYRSLNFGLFGEGGFAIVDPFKSIRTVMPELTAGATFDWFFNTYGMLRLEGRVEWGLYQRNNRAVDRFRIAFAMGLGTVL